jgi:hypothetical protein
MERFKIPIHVEVAVKSSSGLSLVQLRDTLATKLSENCSVFQNGNLPIPDEFSQHIDAIVVRDMGYNVAVSFWQAEVCLHLYRLVEQGAESDFLAGEEEEHCAAIQWELPNAALHGFWDSIIVNPMVKQRLLSYCSSSIQFSDARIDSDIVSWNRMILIHGPPGKGSIA